MKRTIVNLLIFASSSLGISAQNIQKLSEIDLSTAYQDYGNAQRNRAVTGENLSIAGEKFANGIGTQSESVIKLVLQRSSNRFTAKVGVNDATIDYKDEDITKIPMTDGTMVYYKVNNDEKQYIGIGSGNGQISNGSVIFKVLADGKEVYSSGLMQRGDKAKSIDLPLNGIDVLELRAEDADGDISGDHACWLDAEIDYFEIKPQSVMPDYQGEVEPMGKEIESTLKSKISKLKETTLQISTPEYDWLINNEKAKAEVFQASNGKDIVLSNGLVSRVFRIFPNLATVDLLNNMTGESMLRAVSNEGVVSIDGKTYQLGGLDGQFEFGYTKHEWIDHLKPFVNSFRVTDFQISELKPHVNWANSRWSLAKKNNMTGKLLTFNLEGPGVLKGIKVKLHYELYDGLPAINKWFEVENQTEMSVNLDSFILEQLAMAEPESPVELKDAHDFLKPNIHVESNWGFHGFIEKEADETEFWQTDPRYTSQCNYPRVTPCMLEVKLPMGPDQTIERNSKFASFRTWIMPFDSDDRERKGLFIRRMYQTIAPWLTENPIFLHCTSSDEKIVKNAIDQCAETGYEMVILSFGSGLDMEDESEENYAKFRKLREYADSKGIEIGGYSLLSSRWISDDVDVINPETGKRGGMIFGSSPCLSSEWGYDYFRKVKKFYEKTGMRVFENDGSYPGNVCASTCHAHHKGLEDSQWEQRKQIENLYKWMNETGIYTNIPDFGYILNGVNKVGIGYREVNWSLPRERQLVLGRQVMYDGLWERLPSMCWTFVPLTQYHGGGAAATLEPLDEHLDAYKAHMMQNYGSGVQACYRGHRLYDTDRTKEAVTQVITWYKKYREILNSDIIHLRRPSGKDWDGIMHVSPTLEEKGLAMLYNPTNKDIQRTITLPLYYTGLSEKTSIRQEEGTAKTYTLNREYEVEINVNIPANGYTWLVIE